jgi:hypothetical protein
LEPRLVKPEVPELIAERAVAVAAESAEGSVELLVAATEMAPVARRGFR